MPAASHLLRVIRSYTRPGLESADLPRDHGMARTADQEPPSRNTLSHESAHPCMKMLISQQFLPFLQEKSRPHTPFWVWQMEKLRSKGKWLLQGPWGNRCSTGGLPGGPALPDNRDCPSQPDGLALLFKRPGFSQRLLVVMQDDQVELLSPRTWGCPAALLLARMTSRKTAEELCFPLGALQKQRPVTCQSSGGNPSAEWARLRAGRLPKKQRAGQSPEPGCCVLRPMRHQPALGFQTLEKSGTMVGAPAWARPGPWGRITYMSDFGLVASPLGPQSSLLEMGLTRA